MRAMQLDELEAVMALIRSACVAEDWRDERSGMPLEPEKVNLYQSTGHLLVNLGLGIFRFSDFRYFCVFTNFVLGNLVVRYQGKFIQVSWIDPGQNGRF